MSSTALWRPTVRANATICPASLEARKRRDEEGKALAQVEAFDAHDEKNKALPPGKAPPLLEPAVQAYSTMVLQEV